MNRDDIIRMARKAGFMLVTEEPHPEGGGWHECFEQDIERFAVLVAAAERQRVAAWMLERSYATGHGDTTEDLLKELEWQVREAEREACARVCEGERRLGIDDERAYYGDLMAAAIRARGQHG